MVDCFTRYFGDRAAKPERYIERLWAEEEFSRGCYGCHLPPGAWTNYGEALRAPIGPLHWAGAEIAEVWCGLHGRRRAVWERRRSTVAQEVLRTALMQ